MDNIQWDNLRTKFFKECVWRDSMDGNKIRIDYAPHDLFEWFKKNIKLHEGNQDRELLITNADDICSHTDHKIAEREFYVNQKNTFSGTRIICKKCGANIFIKDDKYGVVS